MAAAIFDDLREALAEKDQRKWVDAVYKAEEAGIRDDEVQAALEETIQSDPVGSYRFMDAVFRPAQAMVVVGVPEDAENWEQEMHLHEAMFGGAFDLAWSVHPHVYNKDPWSEDIDKTNVEVVNKEGWTSTVTGLAVRL
eukprot:gnl/TRDRNA2_/TRDRNA2_180222_c0_seq1.p1 gnl/TRDRNA2_/TRDRNA2_180222_c0~~gnl/TRDRNA2_/TRDRNA2_180222_c0_seq1.p1  ORF type:complete len:139 (+),score=44.46 gnl/TRDRNA2_/TRDRNA2_180222_c0_seq1:68-484(+)